MLLFEEGTLFRREAARIETTGQDRQARRLLQLFHSEDRGCQFGSGNDRAMVGEEHCRAPAGKAADSNRFGGDYCLA